MVEDVDTPEDRQPASKIGNRRERPSKPALTRDSIVATAAAIMRAEGLEKVTMRRVAAELDTGAASLYVYVRNTAELYAAILDEVTGNTDLSPDADDDSWRQQITDTLLAYTNMLFKHPRLAESVLVTRPTGQHYLQLVESLLAFMAKGLIPGNRAAWAVDLLLQAATSTAAEHGGDPEPEHDDQLAGLTAAIAAAPAEAYPQISSLAVELVSGSPVDRLTWRFDVILNGVLHTPLPGNES